MSHVVEHCAKPQVTRHWRRLGEGALWACSCGQVYRLAVAYGYESIFFTWEPVKKAES